jgi:hypothetical protein
MIGPRTRLALLALLLAAAVIHEVRAGGTSPALWLDTIVDQTYVRDCLERDRCSLTGVPTSVRGLTQGLTWLDFRVAAARAGLGLSGTHAAVHVLVALAAVLAAAMAWRLAGPVAAALAAVAFAALVRDADVPAQVLYNSRASIFLGGLACAAAVASASPGTWGRALVAAAVAAMATEVHVVAGLLVLPVAVAAWRGSGSPRLAALALAVFLAALFAFSPGTWMDNVPSLFRGGDFVLRPESPPAPLGHAIDAFMIAGAAGLAVVLAVASSDRSVEAVTLVAIVPPVVVFHLASALRLVDPTTKYLVPWLSPTAAALGASVPGLARLLCRLPGAAGGLASRARVLAGRPWTGVAAVVAAAIAVAAWPLPDSATFHRSGGHRPALTFPEAMEVGAAMRGRGWTFESAARDAAGPQMPELVQALDVLAPWDGGNAPGRAPAGAVVVKAWSGDLPDPLPAGWEAVSRDDLAAVVIAWTRPWLDWEHAASCAPGAPGGAPRCRPVTVERRERNFPEPGVRLQGMPPIGSAESRVFTLRVPARFPASGVEDLVLPKDDRGCAGRVVEVPEGASRIEEGGRRARLVADGLVAGGEVAIEMRYGPGGCDPQSYTGFLPVRVEAPPDEAALLVALMEGPP